MRRTRPRAVKPFALAAIFCISFGCSPGEVADKLAVEAIKTWERTGNREIDFALADAVAKGDLDEAERLLGQGAEIDTRFRHSGGITILMMAAADNSSNLTRFLLEHGADPDIRCDDGRTALMRAAAAGRVDDVRLLLDAGADPAIETRGEKTALSIAREKGHEEIVRILQTSTEADVEAIKTINVDLINAFNAGDVSAAVALVTDDAVDLPPHRPAVIGREAIRSFVQSDFDRLRMNFTDEIVEVEVADDLAVVWSNYRVTLTPAGGGESIESNGKWLKVLKRQPDGSWKFWRNIWNSDNPPPE